MHTSQLVAHDVTKRYDDNVVLDRINVSVRPGEKVGVIGDNGAGKSTLLRLFAALEPVDNGEITVVAPGGVGHLAQVLDLPRNATVGDAIDHALADVRELENGLRAAEAAMAELAEGDLPAALEHYARLTERFEQRGGYDADQRVDVALHGLGLPGLERDRALGALSGGEVSRLALAATLASRPELLLLDEPTNDLDAQALDWLEAHLRDYNGTVVAVSHDRVFLDNLTSVILEVDAGSVRRYGDGYAGYLVSKSAERRRHLREYDEWCRELARHERLLENNADRLAGIPQKFDKPGFGHGSFHARDRAHGAMGRVRNAKERIGRLTSDPVVQPSEPLRFTPGLDTDAPPEEVAAEMIGVSLGDRLSGVDLRLSPGERLLVSGPNGAGKSTLLGLLAGELKPDRGSVRVTGHVAHLRQAGMPWPDRMTVLHAFSLGRSGGPRENAAKLLSLGLFSPDQLRTRMGALSQGQRRRLELARLVASPVDLLLLDEPTNHLSPALVEDLEAALASYAGTLVLVTHDRLMRSRFRGTTLVLGQDSGIRTQAAT